MAVKYRTKNGRADYGFSIEKQTNGSWRAYIVSQPSYGSRPNGAHPTHRLSDGGRRYVCWTQPLWSESAARHVAAQWADCTEDYILKGKTF